MSGLFNVRTDLAITNGRRTKDGCTDVVAAGIRTLSPSGDNQTRYRLGYPAANSKNDKLMFVIIPCKLFIPVSGIWKAVYFLNI